MNAFKALAATFAVIASLYTIGYLTIILGGTS